MLLLMRKRIGSFVIKVFAFFLILGFGAWGVQDMLGYQVGGGGAVAEVGDEQLAPRELYSDVYAEVNNMRRFLGANFDIEQARRLGIIDSVLQRQINTAATRAGAEALGVTISDGLVRAQIIDEPLFKGLAGNFDRERFQQILESNGLNEGGYVQRIRQDLQRQQFVNSVQAGVVAPSRWVDTVYRYREEKREADTVFVADSRMAAVGTPSDTELRTYYKDNEKTFTAPEYRALTYVRLDAADLAKEMEIFDEDLQTAYDEREDEFTTPEKRKVRQMIFSDEAKAKTAAAQLAEGKDFLTVAKEVAGQDEATVDLGEITPDDLLPDLADPVFQLAKGAVSAPLKTSLGWHIVEATDVTPGGTQSFAEVKDTLRQDLAHQKAVDATFDLSNRFEDELGGGASIAEAAGRLGLNVEKLPAIDQAGNDPTGTAVAGLPLGNFVATAFATEEGEDSAMTEAGDDGFFILHVDTVTAPALKPFEKVRAQAVDAWSAAKRSEAAQALAAVVVGFVNDGKKMADGAKEWELEVKPIKDIARTGNSGDVNDALAKKIFDLKPGKAAMERVGDGYRVAALTRVVAAPGGPSEVRKNLATQLAQSMRADLDQQLVSALRDKAGVSVNRAAVDALFGDQPTHQTR